MVVLTACGSSAAQDAPAVDERTAVRSAPVERAMVSQPIMATGTVAPKDEIALSFKIGGVIARIGVNAGEAVRAGAVLAALDLREIDAFLSKARSAAAKAERDLARARRLYADSVVTLVQLQDAETAAEMAAADLQSADFNRRYAVITAPSAGTILRRSAEPGETVSSGTTVLVLGSRARGTVVRAGLTDRDVVRTRYGDAATARFDALPGIVFEGTVTEIGAAAEPGIGTYAVEITLGNADRLAAGMVGSIEIQPAAATPAALVPVEAVLEGDDGEATVFALSADGQRAERRRVRVAFLDGARVAVTSGLDSVTAVLTDGAAWLDDGAAVRLVR